jgi:hypothetical protein
MRSGGSRAQRRCATRRAGPSSLAVEASMVTVLCWYGEHASTCLDGSEPRPDRPRREAGFALGRCDDPSSYSRRSRSPAAARAGRRSSRPRRRAGSASPRLVEVVPEHPVGGVLADLGPVLDRSGGCGSVGRAGYHLVGTWLALEFRGVGHPGQRKARVSRAALKLVAGRRRVSGLSRAELAVKGRTRQRLLDGPTYVLLGGQRRREITSSNSSIVKVGDLNPLAQPDPRAKRKLHSGRW